MPQYNLIVGASQTLTVGTYTESSVVVTDDQVISWHGESATEIEVYADSPGTSRLTVNSTNYDFTVVQNRSSQTIRRNDLVITPHRVMGDGDYLELNRGHFGINTAPTASGFTVTTTTTEYKITVASIASYTNFNTANWNLVTWGSGAIQKQFRVGKRENNTVADSDGRLTLEGLHLTPGVNVTILFSNLFASMNYDNYFSGAYSADDYDFTFTLTRNTDSATAQFTTDDSNERLKLTPVDVGIWTLTISLTDVPDDDGKPPLVADLDLYVHSIYGDDPVDDRNLGQVIRQSKVTPIEATDAPFTGTITEPADNTQRHLIISDIEVQATTATLRTIDRRVLSSTIEKTLGTEGLPLFASARQFVLNDYEAIWPRHENAVPRDIDTSEV